MGYLLNFTPNGMIPTREQTPHLPITPDEIIDDVLQAIEIGANMVHLHARDPVTGKPTHSPERYAEIISGIRRECPDIVICVSTSGRGGATREERAACLDLDGAAKPDMASLTLSSLNFNRQASVNAPDTIQYLADRMRARGIRPELEVFDVGMINVARYLARKGLIAPPYYFNMILGNIACAQANGMHMGLMRSELPDGACWAVGGVGDAQLHMNVLGILEGGGARVGLEDTIWFDAERTRLATNQELVSRLVDIGTVLGCSPCSPREARARLGLRLGDEAS